jgi:aspartate racemase
MDLYKTVGILGGMGPLATADLFHKIIKHTNAKCDQDHIKILINNNTTIPDRTKYLIHGGESPYQEMLKSVKFLENNGADLVIMPCNTAHYFYEQLRKEINIPFLNMIEETAKYIKKQYPNEKSIGLLATEGTSKLGIYHQIFEKYNLKIVLPSTEEQSYITKAIYNIKEGIQENDQLGVEKALNALKGKNINRFILGCTELPIYFAQHKFDIETIDPTTILALAAIKFAKRYDVDKCA